MNNLVCNLKETLSDQSGNKNKFMVGKPTRNTRSFHLYYVVGLIRVKDGKLITDNGEICNVLNDFFACVFNG
jgi:hypothetical protein